MKSFPVLTTISRLAILALMLPAGMLVAQNPDSSAITKLLAQVKSDAAVADFDAHKLESYTRSQLQWQTHASQLNLIKEHANRLIEDGNELSAMRDEGSPWQQEAIDHISSLLPEIATHLTTTIDHFNANLTHTEMKPYQDLVRANQALIHQTHEIIADYVDYGEAKAKADALEKQLQLPASS